MALNIRVNVAVAGGDFNSATATRVRNGIELGDRAAGASWSSASSNLEGDLPDVAPEPLPATPASLGAPGAGQFDTRRRRPQLASREDGGTAPDGRPHAAPLPLAGPARPAGAPPAAAPQPPKAGPGYAGQAAPPPRPASAGPEPPKIGPGFAGQAAPPAGPAPHGGSAEVNAAIRDAAAAANIDVNTMRSFASIESDMDPGSNRNNGRRYKGLFQLGPEEWQRHGSGSIYDARDNAMAAARLFKANREAFRNSFGRDPTDRELYMLHQQGLGFYTRGAMTNIGGNPYPGMRGPQTHESFEEGWGREVERRARIFAGQGETEAPAATMPGTPGATAPGAINAVGDKPPEAFIMHHTGGGGTPGGVMDTLRQRHLGVQYIMDREGNIFRAGGPGASHMLPGWGKGAGLNNANVVGMEVIARDDKDVTARQVEAAKAFIEKYYPHTPVLGHGEVNPGHKEADEGASIVRAINKQRAEQKAAAPAAAIPPTKGKPTTPL